jgi:hypothetical protein
MASGAADTHMMLPQPTNPSRREAAQEQPSISDTQGTPCMPDLPPSSRPRARRLLPPHPLLPAARPSPVHTQFLHQNQPTTATRRRPHTHRPQVPPQRTPTMHPRNTHASNAGSAMLLPVPASSARHLAAAHTCISLHPTWLQQVHARPPDRAGAGLGITPPSLVAAPPFHPLTSLAAGRPHPCVAAQRARGLHRSPLARSGNPRPPALHRPMAARWPHLFMTLCARSKERARRDQWLPLNSIHI